MPASSSFDINLSLGKLVVNNVWYVGDFSWNSFLPTQFTSLYPVPIINMREWINFKSMKAAAAIANLAKSSLGKYSTEQNSTLSMLGEAFGEYLLD